MNDQITGPDKKMKSLSDIKRNLVHRFKLQGKVKPVIFVVIIALIGSWLLWSSHAATTSTGKIEAEQMALPSGATLVNDTFASGGQAMMLTSPGETTGQITLSSRATSFSITVRGTSCSTSKWGWWKKRTSSQNIVLSVDGNQLLNKNIYSGGWTTYSGTTSLVASAHQVNIKYTASSTSTCAQALYLDVVSFYGEIFF